MRKQIQVSVTSPCQEDWNKMHPNSNGRYCDQCEKTVIDFTGKSDAEIFRLLSKNNQNVCGRFTDVQLDRTIAEPISQKRKNVWAMLMTALLTLSASVSNAQKKKIGRLAVKTEEILKQEEILRKTTIEKQIPQKQFLGEVMVVGHPTQISITIIGDDDRLLPDASLYIHGSLKRIAANEEGKFLYDKNETGKKAEISFIGYESQTIILRENQDTIVLRSKKNDLQPVCIRSQMRVLAGGISVRRVTENPAKKTEMITPLKSVSVSTSENAFFIKNIYPNPVHPGTDIRIELAAGNYNLQLLSTEGKAFGSCSAMISKGLYGSLKIPATLPAGQYFVRAIDLQTGKQAVKSLLIAF